MGVAPRRPHGNLHVYESTRCEVVEPVQVVADPEPRPFQKLIQKRTLRCAMRPIKSTIIGNAGALFIPNIIMAGGTRLKHRELGLIERLHQLAQGGEALGTDERVGL